MIFIKIESTPCVPALLTALYDQPLEKGFMLQIHSTISDDLSWAAHIIWILMKRQENLLVLYIASSQGYQLFKYSYISLMTPHLGYTSLVWSPQLIKHICQLEEIQKLFSVSF